MQEVVTVSVERVIKVGAGYTIVPSEVFQGLERGSVRVRQLYKYEDMESDTQAIADMWLDEMGSLDCTDIATEQKKGLWVLYTYTDRIPSIYGHELLPIDVFAHHVVPRY